MQNLAVPLPIPEVELKATVVSGAKAASGAALPTGRFLTGVQLVRDRAVTTACRAGIYARVMEVVNGGAARVDRRRVVWSAYYRDGDVPSSVPNLRCKDGRQYVMEVWGLAEFVGEVVRAKLTFDEQPSGGTYIHHEAPGEGVGQPVVVSLGDPAAGAEYATQTVPALERWAIDALQGRLVSDATVANRVPMVIVDDGANEYVRLRSQRQQVASETVRYSFMRGVTSEDTTLNAANSHVISMPDIMLLAGHRASFSTVGLQAGDNWAAGFALVRKWVMPDG